MSLSKRDIEEIVQKEEIDSKYAPYPLTLDFDIKFDDNMEHKHYDEGWVVRIIARIDGEKYGREVVCPEEHSHQVLSNQVHNAVDDLKQALWEEHIEGVDE